MIGIKYGFWTMLIVGLIFVIVPDILVGTGSFDAILLLIVPMFALLGATVGGIIQRLKEFLRPSTKANEDLPAPPGSGIVYGFWVFATITLIFTLGEAFFSGASSDFVFRIILTPLITGAIGAVLGAIVQFTEQQLRRRFPPKEELEEEIYEEEQEELQEEQKPESINP